MLARVKTMPTPSEPQARRADLLEQARKEQLERSAQRMLRALASAQDARV